MAYKTIWIVEAEAEHRAVLVTALSRINAGPVICEFASCAAALAAVNGQAPDLLVINADSSGLEGVAQFKALWPALDLVIVTAGDDAATLRRAIGAGAVGVLNKGAPCAEIAFCLRQVAGSGASVTSCFLAKLFELVATSSASPADLYLSEREGEVLDLLAQGRAKKEIAGHLSLSKHTVDTYIRRVYSKLKVGSRGAAVAKALRLGWRCPF